MVQAVIALGVVSTPRGHGLVEGGAHLHEILGRSVLDFQDLFAKVVEGAESFRTGPCFGHGAAPGAMDEADRYAEFAMESSAEEVGRGRELGDAVGAASTPAARLDVGQRPHGRGALDLKKPDLGIVGARDLGLEIEYSPPAGERHRHVGLSRRQPDLAHQNVREEEPFAVAVDDYLVRAAGGEGIEIDSPGTVTGRSRHLALAGDGDRYFRAGACRTPNRNFHLALQHHVIGEQSRKPESGGGERSGAGRRAERPEDEGEEQYPKTCMLLFHSGFPSCAASHDGAEAGSIAL